MPPRSLLLAAALLLASPAAAHGLHAGEGTVTVLPDRVVVAAGEEDLTELLVLRDGAGRRLAGREVHLLDRPLRWLVLQLAPDDGLPRRLSVAVATPAGSRVVTLTSGGNVALVRVTPGPPHGCGDGILEGEAGLEEIRARLLLEDPLRLEVDLPLGLLESFVPLERADPEVLSVEEQQAAGPAVRQLVRARLGAVGASARFVGPDGEEGPLAAWTARARVSATVVGSSLRWDLFNARVLRARVAVVDGDRCVEREVSTYRPQLEWTP